MNGMESLAKIKFQSVRPVYLNRPDSLTTSKHYCPASVKMFRDFIYYSKKEDDDDLNCCGIFFFFFYLKKKRHEKALHRNSCVPDFGDCVCFCVRDFRVSGLLYIRVSHCVLFLLLMRSCFVWLEGLLWARARFQYKMATHCVRFYFSSTCFVYRQLDMGHPPSPIDELDEIWPDCIIGFRSTGLRRGGCCSISTNYLQILISINWLFFVCLLRTALLTCFSFYYSFS